MSDIETRDTSVAVAPAPRPRPALDRWCRERDLNDAQAGKLFKCSKNMMNLMRRPFDDPARKRPGQELMTRIIRVTDGVLRPEDFSPPVSAILAGMSA